MYQEKDFSKDDVMCFLMGGGLSATKILDVLEPLLSEDVKYSLKALDDDDDNGEEYEDIDLYTHKDAKQHLKGEVVVVTTFKSIDMDCYCDDDCSDGCECGSENTDTCDVSIKTYLNGDIVIAVEDSGKAHSLIIISHK